MCSFNSRQNIMNIHIIHIGQSVSTTLLAFTASWREMFPDDRLLDVTSQASQEFVVVVELHHNGDISDAHDKQGRVLTQMGLKSAGDVRIGRSILKGKGSEVSDSQLAPWTFGPAK